MEHYAILRVDLTTGTARREMVPDDLVAAFIGGKGLAAHYLATEMPAGADPLGPDNLLIFMTGPASGIFPGTCRHAVVTKSPATGGFLDTYAGGYFAWELRRAGLLGIIVRGSADHPVYLMVDDGEAALHDANELAGRSIVEVDDDPRFADYRVVAIGPAGENRVGMSCIGNNAGHTKNGRSGFNGRGGSGAVMGAKNLKAIAVRGSGRPEAGAEAKELRKSLALKIQAPDSASSWLNAAGTPVIVDWTNGVQVLPTRNFTSGSFEGSDSIGHEPVIENLLSREACYNCPVRCGPHVKAPEGEGAFPGVETGKLEYETIGLGASNTGNADFSSIVKFSAQCDELGLDTISTGAAVAFAMDCAERGLIDSPLRFGDSLGQAALVEDIAYRRGLGAALADGIAAAARAWAVDEAVVPVFQIKNLEFPAYDPRGSVGMALAYATSDRGACHMRSWPIAAEALSEDESADPFGAAGKAAFVMAEQNDNSAEWCLVGCDFVGYGAADAVAMLTSLGFTFTTDDWATLGERVWNLVRLFNLREGWTAADDSMPAALATPLADSGRSLAPEVFAEMMRDYYDVRGWDTEGRPKADLVARLDLHRYSKTPAARP